MSYKTIGALVIIIFVVVGFIIWKAPLSAPGPDETATTTPDNTESENTIIANHFYDASTNMHVIEGSITLPTPCHALQHRVQTDGPTDTDITVVFTATSSAEICTQVLSQKLFHVEFSAAENATIRATLNGEARELRLSAQGDVIEKL